MSSQNNLRTVAEGIVTINGRSALEYWCDRFSVSPFTLFQLLKTVGNNATEIGEFLHKHCVEEAGENKIKKSLSSSTIL
jgi:hypothetical protein